MITDAVLLVAVIALIGWLIVPRINRDITDQKAKKDAEKEKLKPSGAITSADQISGGPEIDEFGNSADDYDPFK